ncbi:MAG: response regulator transcription factor [Cyanobacteria bacterium J06626_23]
MTNALPVSVLLVDDQPEFRQGLRTLLTFYTQTGPTEFQVVGEAASAEQAVDMIGQQQPMLTLLDMELAQGDGIQVLGQLATEDTKTRVLALSAHNEDDWIFKAMQAGAKGYVCKSQVATQLCEAMATVLQDEIYLAPELATGFFRLFHFYSGRTVQSCQTISLTDREQEVLHWLVQGASNDAIANQLFITVATVKAHLTAIFEKLEVRSRTQAIVKALKLGLVTA